MEHGKLKYVRIRILALFFLFFVGILGCALLYGGFAGFDRGGDFPMHPLYFLGAIFAVFGFIGGVWHFFHGIKYTKKNKVDLDELESYSAFPNGILVAVAHYAEFITHKHKGVVDRGYIYIEEELDRKKRVVDWHFRMV